MPEAPFTWQRHAQAEQTTFRAMLQALSYPGRVVECPLAHGPAWLQALACLMDASTGLADVHQGLTPALWRQLGARPEAAEGARLVLADAAQPTQFQLHLATLARPEAGAPILLRFAALGSRHTLALRRPGRANSPWHRVGGGNSLG